MRFRSAVLAVCLNFLFVAAADVSASDSLRSTRYFTGLSDQVDQEKPAHSTAGDRATGWLQGCGSLLVH